MITLAGAISEELVYGDRSTGARNDFNQAWQTAREIVQSGLSSLGVVSIDDVPADMLYNECRTIIDKMETATHQLLSERLPLANNSYGIIRGRIYGSKALSITVKLRFDCVNGNIFLSLVIEIVTIYTEGFTLLLTEP